MKYIYLDRHAELFTNVGDENKKDALRVSKGRIAISAAKRHANGEPSNCRLLFGQNVDVISFRRVERIACFAVFPFPAQFNDASGDGLGAGGPFDRARFRDPHGDLLIDAVDAS